MTLDTISDGSDAHHFSSGIIECAQFLRDYNNWRRGDDDNEFHDMPHPKEIGINIDFAIKALDALSGHDHLMVIAAFRYCLGRSTYIVGECAAWIIKTWPLLNEQTKTIIKRELEEQFELDDRARAEQREYKTLGLDCDRREWERVRKLWRSE